MHKFRAQAPKRASRDVNRSLKWLPRVNIKYNNIYSPVVPFFLVPILYPLDILLFEEVPNTKEKWNGNLNDLAAQVE